MRQKIYVRSILSYQKQESYPSLWYACQKTLGANLKRLPLASDGIIWISKSIITAVDCNTSNILNSRVPRYCKRGGENVFLVNFERYLITLKTNKWMGQAFILISYMNYPSKEPNSWLRRDFLLLFL